MATRRNAEINIDVTGADDARVDVKKVEGAFDQLGDAAGGAAAPAIRAIEEIQNRYDKASKDMASVTQRDVNAMQRNLTAFENTLEKTFGDASDAPQELQEALHKMERQVREVSSEFGEMDDAVKDNTANVKIAGDTWPGLGNAIEGVGGKMGTAVAKFGLYTAALSEGMQMGRRFAEAIGTDFSEFEAATANLGKGAASITQALTTDGFLAAWHQTVAVVKNAGDSIASTGRALDAFNAVVQAGVSRTDALRISQEDLFRIQAAHGLALQGGTEAMNLFNRAVASHDPTNLAEALDALSGKFANLKQKHQELTAAEATRKEAIAQTVAAIQSQIAALEAERIAREKGLNGLKQEILERQNYKSALEDSTALAQAAADVQGGLSGTMAEELKRILELLPAYDSRRAQVERMTQALEGDIAVYRDGLTPEREKELEHLADQLSRYGELEPAQRAAVEGKIREMIALRETTVAAKDHAEAIHLVDGKWTNITEKAITMTGKLGEANAGMRNVADTAREAHPHIDKTAQAMQDVNVAAIKLGENKGTITDFGSTLASQTTVVATYTTEITRLNGEVSKLADNLLKAANGVKALGSADSDGGVPSPRSGSGTTGSW